MGEAQSGAAGLRGVRAHLGRSAASGSSGGWNRSLGPRVSPLQASVEEGARGRPPLLGAWTWEWKGSAKWLENCPHVPGSLWQTSVGGELQNKSSELTGPQTRIILRSAMFSELQLRRESQAH